METAYYVMHPALGVTAVVYAPSTEKARTTFLDWLERNHLMRRADRQQLRKDMVAKKLEDPNVQSDVVLNYGYQEAASIIQMPSSEPEPSFEDYANMESMGHPFSPGKEETPVPKQLVPLELPETVKEEPRMPIQKVMLRGFA